MKEAIKNTKKSHDYSKVALYKTALMKCEQTIRKKG